MKTRFRERGLAFKAKPDFENPGDENKDNIYEVTVVAADGDTSGALSGTLSVTVKVTDVIEVGKVSLLPVTDPVVGTELVASLEDSDGVIMESVEWIWHRSVNLAFTGTLLGDPPPIKIVGREAAYTPTAADADMYLRAQATYLDRTDGDGEGEQNLGETETTEPTPVPAPMGFKNVKRSDVTTPVQHSSINQAPWFIEGSSTVRHVRENVQEDLDIGAVVEARDPDGNGLSYTIGGTDKGSFDIDSTDGQLSTKAGVDLNYERDPSYTVIVTANDNTQKPNDQASIKVTILVIDEDEKPNIWEKGDRTVTTGQAIADYPENSTHPVIDLDAEDPEGVTPIVWSLTLDASATEEGTGVTADDMPDQLDFDISGNGELTFRSPPDFENPFDDTENTAEAAGDNTYNVVVQASDRGNMDQHNWFKVTVTVTNVDETGQVKLTADPDGDDTDDTELAEQRLLQYQPGAILTVMVTDEDANDNVDAGQRHMAVVQRPEQHGPVDQD